MNVQIKYKHLDFETRLPLYNSMFTCDLIERIETLRELSSNQEDKEAAERNGLEFILSELQDTGIEHYWEGHNYPETFKPMPGLLCFPSHTKGTSISEIPFNYLNINSTLLSATGIPGKIFASDFKVRGNHFELILIIHWENGKTSRVLFPSECQHITLA